MKTLVVHLQKKKMDVLDDENDKLILSQIADALENNYLEINPFEDKHEDIFLWMHLQFLINQFSLIKSV